VLFVEPLFERDESRSGRQPMLGAAAEAFVLVITSLRFPFPCRAAEIGLCDCSPERHHIALLVEVPGYSPGRGVCFEGVAPRSAPPP
jgi:hypothetical protein